MAERPIGRMERATLDFLAEATWLGAEHKPMEVGLLVLAQELDDKFSAATFAQFGLTFRWLAKASPGGAAVTDPLEALLNGE